MSMWIKKIAETPINTIAKVVDSLTSGTNSRTNAPSIHAVNEGLAEKWQDIYPVGSIYMNTGNVNPSQLFGGTWQPIKDRFLLAKGDTYNTGATGGSATNTLETANLPSHTHTYLKAGEVAGHILIEEEIPNHRHVYNAVALGNYEQSAGLSAQLYGNSVSPSGSVEPYNPPLYINQWSDGSIDTWGTGGGQAHNHELPKSTENTGSVGSATAVNNMPPYLVVNVWVRTA